MYNSYFGLKEKPFKLVPNPDYLYLSKHHEIALAHLTYAVGQGDGFVVITGEVGTGKTTLCRNFLERLDEKTESAYIFNPKLDSVELLTSICNEFGIRTNHTSLKQLLDVINGYLILKNKEGSKVVLLIDEAQNLSVENLEMVRMLSNLETTRSKLLQIILVGQPELSDKLDSYELRQLAQRISLSAYLSPLSLGETTNYIHHRVHIAAQRSLNLFTPSACRLIYQYSDGIPRMINIASDRALLTAFSLERPKVTASVAKVAIKELSSSRRLRNRNNLHYKKWMVWAALSFAAFVVAGALFLNRSYIRNFLIPYESSTGSQNVAIAESNKPSAQTQESIRTYKIHEYAPSTTPTAMHPPNKEHYPTIAAKLTTKRAADDVLNVLLASLDHENSRFAAVRHLLTLWQQPHPNRAQLPVGVGDEAYFDIAAHQYGLRMYPIESDWAMVRHLNLPAIIPLKSGKSNQTVFAALEKWERGHLYLQDRRDRLQQLKRTSKAFCPILQGNAYIYWRNIIGFDALITEGAPGKGRKFNQKTCCEKRVTTRLSMNPVSMIRQTRAAILDFQKSNHLIPDGLIGPLTKILLIKEANAANFPKLSAEKVRGGA